MDIGSGTVVASGSLTVGVVAVGGDGPVMIAEVEPIVVDGWLVDVGS